MNTKERHTYTYAHVQKEMRVCNESVANQLDESVVYHRTYLSLPAARAARARAAMAKLKKEKRTKKGIKKKKKNRHSFLLYRSCFSLSLRSLF